MIVFCNLMRSKQGPENQLESLPLCFCCVNLPCLLCLAVFPRGRNPPRLLSQPTHPASTVNRRTRPRILTRQPRRLKLRRQVLEIPPTLSRSRPRKRSTRCRRSRGLAQDSGFRDRRRRKYRGNQRRSHSRRCGGSCRQEMEVQGLHQERQTN